MAISTNSAVILARVSSRSQEEEGYSLDSQLKLLRGYCHKNKLTIVKEFKVAETASKQHSRIIFQEMIRYLKKEKINHLAVEKTDRLTRNMRDAVTIDDWLEANEARRLHAVKENLLLHKNARSDVKFTWSIYLAFAKKYTDGLREEAMKGWAEKLAQGWLPASPPPGYMTVIDCGKHIHIPNPETMGIIQQAFALYLVPLQSVSSVTQTLADMGLVNSKGKPHANSRIAKMLRNPFYIGINRFDGKDYPGAQEPIISKELFNAVQDKMSGNPGKGRGKNLNLKPIFKGMIKCNECGRGVSWSLHKGRYYGGCSRSMPECEYPYLREDRVEALVLNKLEEIKDKGDVILERLNASLDIVQKQNVGLFRKKMIDNLQDQLKRIDSMTDTLYDDKLAGYITKEKYETKRQQLIEQKDETISRLAKIYEAEAIPEPAALNPIHENPIVNLYLKSNTTQKRIIITTIFDPIVTRNDTVKLERK